jgi:thioredoxin 1
MLKDITTVAEHDAVIGSGKAVVLQFSASWCGPCQRIKPKMIEFSDENKDIIFCYIDIDNAGELAEQYGVQGVPAFYFIKNCKAVGNVVGANQSAIEKEIQNLKC